MTAFAISKKRDRVLIASDTLGYTVSTQPAPLGFVPKVIPLPHLRAALFGRGALAILMGTAARLMLAHTVHDFDSAIEALPAILREATDYYAMEMDIENIDELMAFEGLLAGYSESAGTMRVISFRNYEGYQPIMDEADSYALATIPELPREYIPQDAAGLPIERQLVALMKSLRRYFAEHPEIVPAIIGGEITITEVTRQGVNSRIVHRFEDFEQTRIAAGAVGARILRGEETIDVEAGMCRVEDAIETPAAASSPAGTSRHERRRAEKLARRAARSHGRAA